MLRTVGAVQLDTISVLARSHELVAYARLGAVNRREIERAYWGTPVRAFEFYAHAACILPIEDWPLYAFRRRMWRARHTWHRLDLPERTIAEVRAHLRDGPITATDAGGARASVAGWWNWSAGKRALEAMHLRGEVACVTRRGWKRVYDLAERVVPAALLAQDPSDEECFRALVGSAVRALGVATKRDIADYYRLTMSAVSVPDRRRLFSEALESWDLPQVHVEGWDEPAYVHQPTARARAGEACRTTLLSPFDSLIWYRPRAERMWGIDFLLEAYKPHAQRVHGYFSMPLLCDGGIVGRVDPAREGETLVVRGCTLDTADHVPALAAALREAASWVNCTSIRIDGGPRALVSAVRRML